MNKTLYTLLFFCGCVMAETYDSGEISNLYVNVDGHIAIKLNNGFPNAKSSNECPGNTDWAEGWAGTTKNSPVLKSALLAAHTTQAKVTVVISGCDINGRHLGLQAIFMSN